MMLSAIDIGDSYTCTVSTHTNTRRMDVHGINGTSLKLHDGPGLLNFLQQNKLVYDLLPQPYDLWLVALPSPQDRNEVVRQLAQYFTCGHPPNADDDTISGYKIFMMLRDTFVSTEALSASGLVKPWRMAQVNPSNLPGISSTMDMLWRMVAIAVRRVTLDGRYSLEISADTFMAIMVYFASRMVPPSEVYCLGTPGHKNPYDHRLFFKMAQAVFPDGAAIRIVDETMANGNYMMCKQVCLDTEVVAYIETGFATSQCGTVLQGKLISMTTSADMGAGNLQRAFNAGIGKADAPQDLLCDWSSMSSCPLKDILTSCVRVMMEKGGQHAIREELSRYSAVPVECVFRGIRLTADLQPFLITCLSYIVRYLRVFKLQFQSSPQLFGKRIQLLSIGGGAFRAGGDHNFLLQGIRTALPYCTEILQHAQVVQASNKAAVCVGMLCRLVEGGGFEVHHHNTIENLRAPGKDPRLGPEPVVRLPDGKDLRNGETCSVYLAEHSRISRKYVFGTVLETFGTDLTDEQGDLYRNYTETPLSNAAEGRKGGELGLVFMGLDREKFPLRNCPVTYEFDHLTQRLQFDFEQMGYIETVSCSVYEALDASYNQHGMVAQLVNLTRGSDHMSNKEYVKQLVKYFERTAIQRNTADLPRHELAECLRKLVDEVNKQAAAIYQTHVGAAVVERTLLGNSCNLDEGVVVPKEWAIGMRMVAKGVTLPRMDKYEREASRSACRYYLDARRVLQDTLKTYQQVVCSGAVGPSVFSSCMECD